MKILKGWKKYVGLMFTSKSIAEPVCFEFDEDVLIGLHTWFVFFPCKLIWKDKNNKIIEERIVKPFQMNIKPSKPFRKIEEYPIVS